MYMVRYGMPKLPSMIREPQRLGGKDLKQLVRSMYRIVVGVPMGCSGHGAVLCGVFVGAEGSEITEVIVVSLWTCKSISECRSCV